MLGSPIGGQCPDPIDILGSKEIPRSDKDAGLAAKPISALIAAIVIIAAIAGYWWWHSVGQSPDYIKIGFVTPLTGGLASFAEGDPWVVKQMETAVNSNGGIFIREYGRRIPIKIFMKDSQSNPDLAAQLAAGLATKEKVDVLVSLHVPIVVNPVSKQVDRYGIPSVVSEAPILSWLKSGPYDWVYDFFISSLEVTKTYVDFWDLYFRDNSNMVVAGVSNSDVDGRIFNELTMKEAMRRGYKVAGIYLVAPGTRDFSKIIQEMKDRHVELLHVNMIPPDFQAFWSQAHAMGFVPKSLVGGRFVLFYSQAKALGNLAIGITCSIWVYPTFPYRSSLTGEKLGDFLSRYEKETGKKWSQAMVDSYSAFEVTIDSLKRAGSLDKGRIRDAIAGTNLSTLVGRICFSCALTPEQRERYKDFPILLKYEDHYQVLETVLVQWRIEDGKLIQVPVYTTIPKIHVRPAIPIPRLGG